MTNGPLLLLSLLGCLALYWLLNRDPGYTNLKYGVAYLSNAYVVAERNPDRAVALYSSGYFYEAKRKGLLGQLTTARSDEPPPPK